MAKSLCAQLPDSSPDTFWSNCFASMWYAMQSCSKSFFKLFCISLRRIINLSTAKPQCDHSIIQSLFRHRKCIFGTPAIQLTIWEISHNIKNPSELDSKILLCLQSPFSQSSEKYLKRNAQRKFMRTW